MLPIVGLPIPRHGTKGPVAVAIVAEAAKLRGTNPVPIRQVGAGPAHAWVQAPVVRIRLVERCATQPKNTAEAAIVIWQRFNGPMQHRLVLCVSDHGELVVTRGAKVKSATPGQATSIRSEYSQGANGVDDRRQCAAWLQGWMGREQRRGERGC